MFEEELHSIKDDLESLHEKCESMNNTILKNPVPIQINDTTSPTQTDNPKTYTTAISRSINERVERANNIIVFNLQEESNESDKNTIMNLCKFIVDREVTCESIRLGRKEEGKIRPGKKVFPDAIVKNCFMKNLNKLKKSSRSL